MSGAPTSSRLGPTRETFRPTRSSTRAAGTSIASRTGAASGLGATQTRSRSTSRPPSVSAVPTAATNGRSGAASASSRTGSAAFSYGPTRVATGLGITSRTSAPGASSAATTAGVGLKRKSRLASGENENEKESTAAKRPALSSAFSEHLTQSSLNRQLLALKTQVTELQNSISEKQQEVNRLEIDLRQVVAREEEEREARTQSEEELASKTVYYEAELSALKRKLVELEADHDDLSDAYSNLSHSTTSQINSLKLEVSTRGDRIALLESQLSDAERRAREERERARELEEALELMEEEGPGNESEQTAGSQETQRGGGRTGMVNESVETEETRMRMDFKEPESSVDESTSVKAEDEEQADDAGIDTDADGEVDPGEEPSMTVDTTAEDDITPTRDIEITNRRSRPASESSASYEGTPGAITPANSGLRTDHAPSSPAVGAARTRSRSASVVSSVESESSRTMSISLEGPNLQHSLHPLGTPSSIASGTRPDPFSRVRRQLGLASSPSRRRSSLGVSRDRENDYEIIRAELTRQTSHISYLESTNARLSSEVARFKARAEGTEILREEKRELERRVEGMESLRKRVAELEAAADEFARREKEWQAGPVLCQRAANESNTPAKTPVGVTQQLSALRKAHATLLDEHGGLKAALRANEVELSAAREEAECATRDLERLSKDVDRLQDSLSRKEQERVLLGDEARFLQALVSSYRKEEVADISMCEGEAPGGTAKLEERIVQLESLLDQYKTTIRSLEKEVDRLQRSEGNSSHKSQEEWDQLLDNVSKLGEELKNAQAELNKREDRIEELEQSLFELGGEIGAGRHIPPAMRVLSLRQNPAQEWADTRQQILDLLKAENQALLARLKELEDNGMSAPLTEPAVDGENARLVPRESYEVVKKEVEVQAKNLEQEAKRGARIREVYAEKSTEFRKAIESILGVKIVFNPSGFILLSSIYDLSATYVFQASRNDPEEGGMNMQLIAQGDKCPEEFEGLMRMWIHDEMCIPCFIASVTLECYDKWKREQH